ncbi:hypothetical protein K7X08_033413 [Anisodus acutangulus]|uniref:Uncharacterized protein n=1 Tax=Anisodus acutangulus TaxID=402998 RepID=A0A9Q1RC38_9SOLA|nr:hypothetical protein K7X08_033413 [Anisodus acutangulus]
MWRRWCYRGMDGNLVAAFGCQPGINTNINVVETLDLKIGVEWCCNNGIRILELSSFSCSSIIWTLNILLSSRHIAPLRKNYGEVYKLLTATKSKIKHRRIT